MANFGVLNEQFYVPSEDELARVRWVHVPNDEGEMAKHSPHPRIELRKPIEEKSSQVSLNRWLAVKITSVVGSMWCAYAFAALCLISLPEAIAGGTAPLIAWICQTFLQLVLLSIIMVGQNVAAQKTDRQMEQTYRDAEALLEIDDEVHRLIKVNGEIIERVHEALEENTRLTQELSKAINEGRVIQGMSSARDDHH